MRKSDLPESQNAEFNSPVSFSSSLRIEMRLECVIVCDVIRKDLLAGNVKCEYTYFWFRCVH